MRPNRAKKKLEDAIMARIIDLELDIEKYEDRIRSLCYQEKVYLMLMRGTLQTNKEVLMYIDRNINDKIH